MKATMRTILEETRLEAAKTAWQRAMLASRLRHVAKQQGYDRSAKTLAGIKDRAIRRAISLVPKRFIITIDNELHPGLPSVCFRGHGRLHLPSLRLALPA